MNGILYIRSNLRMNGLLQKANWQFKCSFINVNVLFWESYLLKSQQITNTPGVLELIMINDVIQLFRVSANQCMRMIDGVVLTRDCCDINIICFKKLTQNNKTHP